MNRRQSLTALAALATGVCSRQPLARQSGRVWRIGFLTLNSSSLSSKDSAAFLDGMRALGYVEGKDLIMEWRYADGNFERLPALATDLVRTKPHVIVADASAAIGAAQKATNTIPIVMATTGDPVGSGFVKSLARPGGNITGLTNMSGDIGAKLLDLLSSSTPKLSRVALLVTPTSPTSRAHIEGVRGAAGKAGVTVVVFEVSTSPEIEKAFSAMSQQNIDGVIVGTSPLFGLQRQHLAELALKHRLPSIYGNPAYAEVGGLMAYGTARRSNFVRAASYVDKILKGAKPADLPVEQPTAFELAINLKTAKALGLTIPQSILLRADEVIE